LRDELLDLGIGDRLAAFADRLVVREEALAGLLAEPALFDELGDDRNATQRCTMLRTAR